MLLSGKPSYTFGTSGTYTSGTPIDINPETLGNAKSSYRFVEPIGGGGGTEITDYVSKTNGGTFSNLIMYPSALTILDDYDIVYKSWVDDEIDVKIAAIGAGTVSSITAGNGMNFSTITTTGSITLGTPSDITTTSTSSATAGTHSHAIVGYQPTLDGTGFVVSTAGVISYDTTTYLASADFNILFDARFGIKSIADLGTKSHLSLTDLPGSSEGFHLNVSAYTNVNRYATTSQDGILSAADWNKFNNTSSGSDSLFELVGEAPNQYVRCNYPLTSLYDITAFATSQYVPYNIWDYMPVASSSTLGGIKIGSGLEISGDGTLSTTSSSGGTGNNNIYHIRLNSGATVTQRLIGLTGDIDYPASWTLVADNNALVIVHNLNTIVSIVKIFSKNGVTSDLIELQGNIAYSTFTNKYSYGYNSIKLDNLATVSTELYLSIII